MMKRSGFSVLMCSAICGLNCTTWSKMLLRKAPELSSPFSFSSGVFGESMPELFRCMAILLMGFTGGPPPAAAGASPGFPPHSLGVSVRRISSKPYLTNFPLKPSLERTMIWWPRFCRLSSMPQTAFR